jgi:hypothetical protein
MLIQLINQMPIDLIVCCSHRSLCTTYFNPFSLFTSLPHHPGLGTQSSKVKLANSSTPVSRMSRVIHSFAVNSTPQLAGLCPKPETQARDTTNIGGIGYQQHGASDINY